MLKMIALLTRKEGLSHEDFARHWVETHAPLAHQGCSTLWNAEEVEEAMEAADGGAEAVLGERASAVGLEDVEGEAAAPCEDAGVDADARAILAHGDVTAVVGGVLDLPVISDGDGSAGGGEGGAGEVEGGLGGAAPEAGADAAGEDVTPSYSPSVAARTRNLSRI